MELNSCQPCYTTIGPFALEIQIEHISIRHKWLVLLLLLLITLTFSCLNPCTMKGKWCEPFLICGGWSVCVSVLVCVCVSVQEANLRVLLLDVSRDDAQADIGHLPELQRAWGARGTVPCL